MGVYINEHREQNGHKALDYIDNKIPSTPLSDIVDGYVNPFVQTGFGGEAS